MLISNCACIYTITYTDRNEYAIMKILFKSILTWSKKQTFRQKLATKW